MALREELLNPIPGDNPSGVSLRYEPIFDKIKDARVERDTDFFEGGAKFADFGFVIKQSEEILTKKSKDLQIAAWLAEAYLKKQGFAGLNDGLSLIKGLIENFWDTLHPELEDGDPGLRLAPLDWCGSYLATPVTFTALTKGNHNLHDYKQAQALGFQVADDDYSEDAEKRRAAYATAVQEGKVTGDAFDAGFKKTTKEQLVAQTATLETTLELLESLAAVCEEKFRDDPPSWEKLRGAVTEVHHTSRILLLEKKKAEPDEDSETVTDETQESSGEEGEESSSEAVTVVRATKRRSKSVTSMEPADWDESGDRLGAVAVFCRTQEPSNPAPFLMLRGFRWGELRASGGTSPDALLLEPPATEIRQQIKKASLEGNWQEVLDAAEGAMATKAGRGWLDLQRYTVRACEELGHYAVATAIKSELKCLLVDMPDLLNMTLMDDTPTANSETQSWLRDNVLPPPPTEAPPVVEEEQQQESYSSSYSYEPEPVSSSNGDGETSEPKPPDAFDLAREAAQQGNHEQAIEILVREATQERSGRAKFQRKMQLAQICITIRKTAIAKPILEELAAEIDKRKLEEWESGELVAHTLVLLHRCLDDGNERKQQLFNLICRIDPMQALNCLK